VNSTPDSNSKRKKNPTPLKKSGKSFKGKFKPKGKKTSGSWGAYLRRWFMNPKSLKEEYVGKVKVRENGKLWVEAKCKCKDQEGNTIPYVYCPKTKYDPEGWWCPSCGKGHRRN
jgi:hypothetical protein